MSIRVGIDTGGTFTDCVLYQDGRDPVVVKVPSTPDDPSKAVLSGLTRLCAEAGVEPKEIDFLGYGTTVATNAMLQGHWAKAALVVSAGFGDVLEIATQARPELYNLRQVKPRPLVPRDRCFEIPGRMDPWGDETEAFDESAAESVIEEILAVEPESVAISLLFSYANPTHERRLRDMFADRAPDLYVCISSDISPEPREYYRTSSAVINAGLAPVVRRYLGRLEDELAEQGAADQVRIMQSSGGMVSLKAAAAAAHNLVLSGPAGGMSAAEMIAERLDRSHVLTFDMGGTSTDVGLIIDGLAARRQSTEIAGGYQLHSPTLDIHTVGAGGGSVAWRDVGGALRVGPQSQGADPGPACYGLGGELPTVTDANLFLGRLDGSAALGGDLRLDPERAEAVISALAEELDLDPIRTACGILDVANANMVGALRVVSSRRGLDPREFSLVAFGGAGPLHAVALARELEIGEVILPKSPGVLSAQGLLTSDLRHDVSAAFLQALADVNPIQVEKTFRELEAAGSDRLGTAGKAVRGVRMDRTLDLRYQGQDYYLQIALPNGSTGLREGLEIAAREFHETHRRVYGHHAPEEPVEIVNVRVAAVGEVDRVALNDPPSGEESPSSPRRQVYFDHIGWADTAVIARSDLEPGSTLDGPLVLEQRDSTAVVAPGQTLFADASGAAVVRLRTEVQS